MPIQTLFGPPPPPTVFERLQQAVSSTRQNLAERIEEAVHGQKEIDADLLEHLEATLLGADLGVATTTEVLDKVRQQVDRRQISDAGQLTKLIKQELLEILRRTSTQDTGWKPVPPTQAGSLCHEFPQVVLVIGVNGVGKTTTIGKLAHQLTSDNKRVLLCAADTFRAAAIEQLEIWGQRTGTEVIKQKPGADPSAVVFDAIASAKARGIDYVIVDTAGRLHTKSNLMAELEKMSRTAARAVPGAPHEVLLIMDATTGQNGLQQARRFTESVGVTGIILAKLDGTAKGGVVIAIARELKLPIRYVGIGEQKDDLVPFDPQQFIDSLFRETPR
jgi:fused signal recognition particle receptor